MRGCAIGWPGDVEWKITDRAYYTMIKAAVSMPMKAIAAPALAPFPPPSIERALIMPPLWALLPDPVELASKPERVAELDPLFELEALAVGILDTCSFHQENAEAYSSSDLNVVHIDDAGMVGVYGMVVIAPKDSGGCVYVYTVKVQSVKIFA